MLISDWSSDVCSSDLRAFLDAKQYGWSKAPIVEMLIPSTIDDSLAPPGQHVASLFCQQFAPELPGGRDWDDEEGAAADCIIDTVEKHTPGFRASIIEIGRAHV